MARVQPGGDFELQFWQAPPEPARFRHKTLADHIGRPGPDTIVGVAIIALVDLIDGELTVTPKTQQLPLKDSPEDKPELVDA